MTAGYEQEGQRWYRRRQITADLELRISAENVRQERTGVHAKVSILGNGTALAWSNFNIERDEDRLRLGNSAHKHLSKNGKEIYAANLLKNDLDQFCAGLWEAREQAYIPELLGGSPEAHPPKFLLKPFIVHGGGTIMFAPPGRGKSYITMLMVVCLDAGLQSIWHVARAVRVLFVNLERSKDSVLDRLGNINEALGLPRERKIPILNARGRSLSDVETAAERYIQGEGIECVFVDSISRAGAGDLNDNQSVNRIVDALNRLCPTWFALAHTPRSDESHIYGGVHFEAGADVTVQLLSEQDEQGPLGVGLQVIKNNDIGRQPLWLGALEFGDSGLELVRKAKRGEFPEIESTKKMSVLEILRQYLLDEGAQSISEAAASLGMNRSQLAQVVLEHPNTFVRVGRLGHKVLYGVANTPPPSPA